MSAAKHARERAIYAMAMKWARAVEAIKLPHSDLVAYHAAKAAADRFERALLAELVRDVDAERAAAVHS